MKSVENYVKNMAKLNKEMIKECIKIVVDNSNYTENLK